ncbi:MAG TPA: sigma-70 family RNA polymerase sigma factor [Chitinophagaceae bacterium]|nr:sigma-70 family RNA polymerase sigma factor [Chitinophagaceae bacterium]
MYRSFYSAMMTICLRYTKNEQDALEALNTGFYKVFKNIAGFTPIKGSGYTWIRTIIINTCLNVIRAKGKNIPTHEITGFTDVTIPPEVVAGMNEDAILSMVQQLPPATRAVFNLYVLDGFTHKEIAGMLNISEGTSKWHLSEARKILQHQLKKYML